MITTVEALKHAVSLAQEAGAVGIDTEFVWDRTFYPTLGLVQIGYPDGHCELIDAPAIEDWSPLKHLIEDSNTIKILHDAQQDLTIIHRACGGLPKNIFDTQRASGFVGLSATISLSELLKTLIKVRLAKTETRSDWVARPLTPEQEKYAEDDVRYSTRLMDKILAKADALDRRGWIDDEMRMYERVSNYEERDPDLEMPRVRGSGSMTQQQKNIVRALGAWRERKARQRNIPRSFVLSDEAIVSLMKRPPKSEKEIKPMKGLSERTVERRGKQIWETIQFGLSGGLPELPNGKHLGPQPDDGYEARVDLALATIKGTCLAAKLDPALIGNRAEITSLVIEAEFADVERHRVLRGWRAAFCGDKLLRLLKGEGSVTIDPVTRLPGFED